LGNSAKTFPQESGELRGQLPERRTRAKDRSSHRLGTVEYSCLGSNAIGMRPAALAQEKSGFDTSEVLTGSQAVEPLPLVAAQ